MADWSSDLGAALAVGDPEYMLAMLALVPKDVLQRAVPYLDHMAKASEKEGKLDECLSYHDQLIQAAPGEAGRHAERARILLLLERFAEALADGTRTTELAPDSAHGYHLQARACQCLGELPLALAAWQQVLRLEPDDTIAKQAIGVLASGIEQQAALRQALDPSAPQESRHIELPAPPQVAFDPALFDDPSIPASSDTFRVEGLRQLLLRYSGQLSAGNAIARLDDPLWLAAWDAALSGTAGECVLFRGSELGVFALRALQHGAAHALCVEAFPLDARIATGMAQKHFLAPWRARHGAAIQGWSEDERRASFEQFASGIDIVAAASAAANAAQCACMVFPQIDHTLLGTGIVKAVRQYCAGERAAPVRVLPAKATVFAMGIQWLYPGAQFQLDPIDRLRWSLYPQALEIDAQLWSARTEAVQLGELDFANFSETTWDIALTASADGKVDAIVFWFELDLGNARISNAPGSALRCIRPAVQYTDPIEVQAGQLLKVQVRVEESRLYFQTRPAAALQRTQALPTWYVPMLGDARRNDAFRNAIEAALAQRPDQLVLDIGAGCALLSMMAAKAGAGYVLGCETNRAIHRAGQEIVALNGLQDRVALVNKDCRELKVPDDLPRRAELALFELFDCSLIGEGILHFLEYARANLLAADARYLPAGATIRAMVIEYRVERIWDIDANLFNPYRASPAFINVDADKLVYRALCEPFDVFAFEFASAGSAAQQKPLCLSATAPGTASAILFWFDLQLDANTSISNSPHGEHALHWKQGLQFLPEVRVDTGMELPLMAMHDGSGLKFQWRQDLLPKEALSKMPLFDPRWLAASAEIDQQTDGLLQHCSQHPDEHRKVADIAQRFAIDPGAHGLNPMIAQRFATMFFSPE